LSKGSRYVADGILVLRRFFPTAEYSFDFLRDSDRQMIATWIRNDLQKRIIKFPFIQSRYVVSIGENPLLLPLFATCTLIYYDILLHIMHYNALYALYYVTCYRLIRVFYRIQERVKAFFNLKSDRQLVPVVTERALSYWKS